MKKVIWSCFISFLISFMTISYSASCQKNDTLFYPLTTPTLSSPQVMPEFAGGRKALKRYLKNSVHCPPEAKGTKGVVHASFIVQADGSISSIRILHGLNESCDREATRVITLMPPWIPGYDQGMKVHTLYYLPVEFLCK